MSVPEGYEKLAVLGISYKGNYDETLTYNYLNAVYYEGSTYVALKDNVTTIPANDGVNWKYLARGFITHLLSELTAIDNQGLLDVAGSTVDAQDLIDKIADKLVNGDTANNTVTFESSDSTTADSWTDVAVLATGEKHSSLFAKISTMFKNIRYIYTHFIKSENILETLEEIVANTQSGKVAGALAVKELNSNLDYAYLTQLIGYSSDNLSLFYAYKENGIITLNLNIPHSITGVFSAKINSVYAPRMITYGIASYSSSSNDVNKIPSASITTDGTINVWVAQALDAIEDVQFSYPMKRL